MCTCINVYVCLVVFHVHILDATVVVMRYECVGIGMFNHKCVYKMYNVHVHVHMGGEQYQKCFCLMRWYSSH